ncbi:hypothetical protein E4K66_30875 [Bradyrhizobium frederickii]|uniref:Uncharacterized protein n=1 Tax=Bradyrhizobium frederickii TaxID=2560054 RepID=A0A4Y9KT85_9BRAD|nr:hypothetical protein [Bradyrhizobium frederickii]TFV34571.1 hypothetical protein E4K66_30875 [Bradyrhizobium frederickii]
MIRDQILIGAGFIVLFAGFMLGYSIAWWQRGRVTERVVADVSGPETAIVLGDIEARVRRSQA